MEAIEDKKGDLVVSNSSSIDEVLSLFIASQDVKESSKKLYRRTLNLFFEWVNRNAYDLSQLNRIHILSYKDSLLSEGLSSLTVGAYITSVRRFYEWAESVKLYPNIAKGIRSPKRKQQFRKQALTPAQAVELLDYYQGESKRDTAIINLLLRTGLRTIEVIRANVGDLTYKGGKRVLMVHGKGRDEKDNFVVLTDKAYLPLRAYLDSRGRIAEDEALFVSDSNNSKGERLSTRTISRIAKEALKGIGLDEKSYTAHSLRHTTAVNILRAGGSLETAQYTLRHSNPATTQIYTATLKEERRLQNSGESLIDNLY